MVTKNCKAMKRISAFFAAALTAVCVSCSVVEIETVPAGVGTDSFEGISFNVEVASTKAVQTSWEAGDRIFVFFDDCPDQTSTSDLNYLLLTYNAGSWDQTLHQVTTDQLKNYLLGRTSGKFDAVCVPMGTTTVKSSTYSEGKYSVSLGCQLFLSQTQADYSVSGTEVSLNVSLAAPYDDYVQVYVDGLEQSSDKDWRLSVYDDAGTAGLKRYEGPYYTPSDHAFLRRDAGYTPAGKGINGVAYGDGTVFQGVLTGNPTSLTFKLSANKDADQPDLFYTKTGITSLEGGMAIKISYSKFAEACNYRTVLYSDGTLIIDEKDSDSELNEGLHGMALAEYDAWHTDAAKYSFSGTGAAGQPWAAEQEDITAVEFGSVITPVSMAYWFAKCTNIAAIDFTNLNTSSCTNMCGLFNEAFRTLSTPIELDLSSFDVSALSTSKALQNFLYKATKVKSVNVSGWVIKNSFDCQNMFRCSNDGVLETIYADEKTDFSKCGKSTGMFLQNPKLTGGNGTAVGDVTDATYARIDTDDTPGYFTLYEGPKHCVLYSDGTLVINEKESDRDANCMLYGSVEAAFDPITGTGFAKEGAPWNSVRTDVINVKFGSKLKPTSTNYWFYGCTGVTDFDFTNLDMGKCTNISNMFYACFQKTGAALDLSSWNVSSLTGKALQNVFSGAFMLTSIDLTGWSIPAAVTDCQNMFRNCCRLETIYVSEGHGFEAIATSKDMFYMMTDTGNTGYAECMLTGGNGTVYSYDEPLDKTYAVIDKPGQPGYFSVK